MSLDTVALVAHVGDRLSSAANPDKAGPMAAYMKTTMPFYGVQNPARKEILRDVADRFPIGSRAEYRAAVEALWAQPHREEKYLAIALARHHRAFVKLAVVPLYRRLIVEGAWWDFVDDVAIRLVGRVMLESPEQMGAKLDGWISHSDMWLRRTAIIAQIGHKSSTDEERLFRFCAERAHEKEFFIRKAIGWALREYAKTRPEQVRAFVAEHHDELSGLSRREATKHL